MQTSRRRLLALSGSAALVALGGAGCSSERASRPSPSPTTDPSPTPPSGAPGKVSAPPATGVLAANLNQALDKIDLAELQAVSGTWIRGFYLMSDANQQNPATQNGPAKLLQTAAQGYGTVLTMKFQYRDKPIPVPGTPAMRTALIRLTKVLAATMGKIDILTVGNEPFFETSKTDRTTHRINAFYEALARHTADYRQAHFGTNCKTKIYMGALTALATPGAMTQQTRRWMTFTAHTPAIAGVDIHPHVASIDQAQTYIDYVLPYLRSDQQFLATEFSLVQLWKQHLSDPVDPTFASQHRITQGTPVWRVIKHATQHPVDEHEWNTFLLSNTWFAANKNFLTDQMQHFRATGKLAIAGYGITQGTAMSTNFGPHSTPWLLNSLFCPDVCKPEPNGLPARNHTWCTQFHKAQHH